MSIQTMDRDYNVSEWTEPILVSHTAIVNKELEAPKNLRFDESGENILWDEVEGADYYYVNISSYTNDERREWLGGSYYAGQPVYNNWKSCIWPFSNGSYTISVNAYSEDGASSSRSDNLIAAFRSERDESIGLPDSIRFQDGCLEWDGVEGAKK